MSDVRINGRRIPALQAIGTLGLLVNRLEAMGTKNRTVLTSIAIGGRNVEFDAIDCRQYRLEPEDTVEAKMETSEQLAYESLQVAQEMAELLVFDLKVATLHIWDSSKYQDKSLETLLNDCNMFLTLAARPIELLGRKLSDLSDTAERCLRQLDSIANNLEDATLLMVSDNAKDACHVLLARVMPAIEKWLGLTAAFAEDLQIDSVEAPRFTLEPTLELVPGAAS